ncbi:hypothetical protein [Nocardia paucivorans]|uniref:hypothetical protein n=1 Tax=Nocardia paucivorans TaxID=114259 RepID=UPI0002F331E4|nr:hypothetical protein [Nocardia paucivorans]
MPENVEVNADEDGGLKDAMTVLEELRDDFEGIAARTRSLMGHMTTACGDDHFGHQFTDGEKGFRKKVTSAVTNSENLSTSFDNYGQGVGGALGAQPLLNGAEQASAGNFRWAD